MKNRGSLAVVALSFFCSVSAPAARADQVVVFSTVAAKGALELIAPEFERDTHHTVVLKFATAAELKSEIEKGAPCDVALLTAAGTDDLIKQGKLLASTRAVAFKSGVGVAGRRGAAPVKVSTSEELKSAVLEARAIALSTSGASGPIMKRAFERLGIAEVMAAKTVLVSSITAPEAVVRGQADLGFTQVSEILDTPGAEFLGPLPPELQSLSTFAIAVSSGAASGNAAKAFVNAISTPRAANHMRAKGLQPG
jgi:molybdate transport system substrate-binding protein